MKYENTSNYTVKTEHTVTDTNNKTYFYNFDIDDTYHIEEQQVTVYINSQPVSDFTVDKTNNNITLGDSITLTLGDKIKLIRNTNVSNRVVNYYNISSFTPNELNYSFKQAIRKGQENEFRITEAEETLVDHEERITQNEEDIANLGDINSLIADLNQAEIDIDNLEIDVNDLYNQVGDNDLDIQDLYNITDGLDLRITDLENAELPIATTSTYGVAKQGTYDNVEVFASILDDQQSQNYSFLPIVGPGLITDQGQLDYYNDNKFKFLTVNSAFTIPYWACDLTEITDPKSNEHWFAPTYTKGGLAKKYEWVDSDTFDSETDDHRYMTPTTTRNAIQAATEELGSGEVLGQILDIPVSKAQLRQEELIEANGSKYAPTDDQMTELKNIYDTSANVVSVDPVQYVDTFDGGIESQAGGFSLSGINHGKIIRKKDNSDGYIMVIPLDDPDTGNIFYRIYETNSNSDLSNWVFIKDIGRNISNIGSNKLSPDQFCDSSYLFYIMNDNYIVIKDVNSPEFYIYDITNETFENINIHLDLTGNGDPQSGGLISGYYTNGIYFLNKGQIQYKSSNTIISTFALIQLTNINDSGDKIYRTGFLNFDVVTKQVTLDRTKTLEEPAVFDSSLHKIQGEEIAIDYSSYNANVNGYLIDIDSQSNYLPNFSPQENKFFFLEEYNVFYDFDSNGNLVDDLTNDKKIRLMSVNKDNGDLKYEAIFSLSKIEDENNITYSSSEIALNLCIDSDTGACILGLGDVTSGSPYFWLIRANSESEFYIREYNPYDYDLQVEFLPSNLNTQFIEKGIGFHSQSSTKTNFTNNINDFINGDLLFADKTITLEDNGVDNLPDDYQFSFTDLETKHIQYSKNNRVIIYDYHYRSGTDTATYEWHNGIALCGYDIADYIQVPDLRDRFDKTGKFKSYVVKSETGGIPDTDLGKENNEY